MTDNPHTDERRRRLRAKRGILFVVAFVAALAACAASVWWLEHQPPHAGAAPVDPRLTYPTPFRNVRPDVKYVGDQVCGNCHGDIAESYRGHPMAHAMAPIGRARPIERVNAAGSNPFSFSRLEYGVVQRDDRMIHRQSCRDSQGREILAIEREVRYACGSGARARSYLIDHDGYLFQSPITWYPNDGKWDLSPSYEKRNQHFSRPVMPGCLFCHCNYADHVPLSVNHYRQPAIHGFAIGCERCHGPGELHVKRREANERVDGHDDTIVHPGRLEHSLREAICQQCHLQGEQRVVARGRSDFDFRPGLPLHLFLMDFVNSREESSEFKFVSSAEQLEHSRCYKESRGESKMGCVTCHDPHRHPAPSEKIAHYRNRCLKCHSEQSCKLPPPARREQDKDDSCIACHMPRTGAEVNHTAMTDHRILRKPGAPMRKRPPEPLIALPDELVPFHLERIDQRDPEFLRNLGVALMQMQDRGLPDMVARAYAEKALPLLEGAIGRDGRDLPALQSRVGALWSLDRHEDALAACETILADWPESEVTLHAAGNLALELNRPDSARSFLERAVKANPWRWQYHQALAIASFRLGEWERGARECSQSLQLGPANAASRSLLIQCYLGGGHRDKAGHEYEILQHHTPENRRHHLRQWYDQQRLRFER
jgi:hypothetical protein